jgi:hypothetical protein
MIRETVDRVLNYVEPKDIFVATNEIQSKNIVFELSDIPKRNIIIEDIMETENLNLVIGIAASITTMLGAWFLIFKFVTPVIKKIKHVWNGLEKFMRDWSGTDSEPGRDRIPGVMERLNEIDGALKNNGGRSIKYAVDRIEIRVNEIDDRLAQGDKKFDEIAANIKRIETNTS